MPYSDYITYLIDPEVLEEERLRKEDLERRIQEASIAGTTCCVSHNLLRKTRRSVGTPGISRVYIDENGLSPTSKDKVNFNIKGKDFVFARDAAEYLGVSIQSVYSRCASKTATWEEWISFCHPTKK